MYTLHVINPADWIEKIQSLIDSNWQETGLDFPFNPDIGFYNRAFDMGILFGVIAIDQNQEVVAYASVAVVPHQHNHTVLFGNNDAIFVHPDYRNSLLSGRLIKLSESEAKLRGATMFMWHCRHNTGLLDMFLKHGYHPVESVVMGFL